MRKILILFCILLAGKGIAQTTLVNSGGATIVITTSTDLKATNVRNDGAGSTITNEGDLYLTGNFNQINGATYAGGVSSWLWFEGTSAQTISSDVSPLVVARLKVDNTTGVQLTQNLSIPTNLDVINGDLDLNGKNVDLGSTGILNEDRDNNHLVKDLTAISDFVQGGGITFTTNVTAATAEVRGTGLYLQRTAGADYPITVTRKHYKGATPSRGGTGIARIYQIIGTPTGTNTTMRIYYASDEITGVGTPSDFVLYRWQSATGWKNAVSSGDYADGTNDIVLRFTEGTGINAFSHWTVGSSATPLPITLLTFAGERVEQAGEPTETVKLEWSTSSEINNKGFEVQVSDNGLAYQKIAFVDGAGNSVSVSSYQLAVSNADDGYYRLKQIDFDGKFSYSPIVFVEGLAGKVVVYPNPNNGTFSISVGKSKLDSPAYLLNAQGIEVWRGVSRDKACLVSTSLPAGMYFLHTTVAGKTKITKVVIER
jgi:hypothetical protein